MAKINKGYLLDDIDDEKVKDILKQNNDNTQYFSNLVEDMVNKYTGGLDELMTNIQTAITDPKNPITDYELESAILKLPNYLYFCGQAIENLSVKQDIAKSIKQNKYSEFHMNTSGTIADKDAKASSEVLYEQIITDIFSRSTKKVSRRIEAGYEMLSACKKVLQRRMLEIERTKVGFNDIADRNENNRITGDN